MLQMIRMMEMGIDQIHFVYKGVRNHNPDICEECVKENKVPAWFTYYGEGRWTHYCLLALEEGRIKKTDYNAQCCNHHYFYISSAVNPDDFFT